MAEQVPAPLAPNQVLDVVNITPAPAVPAPVLPVPEPVLAVPVAQVENLLPAIANNRDLWMGTGLEEWDWKSRTGAGPVVPAKNKKLKNVHFRAGRRRR